MQNKKIKILSKKDLVAANEFHKKILVLITEQKIIGKLKKYWIVKFGLNINKNSGRGLYEVIFSNELKSKNLTSKLIVNLSEDSKEKSSKIHLANATLTFKKIKFSLQNFQSYKNKEKYLLSRYIDQIHPEALTLFPICIGKGIDVGCGYRKTHPQAIGVDWIKKGNLGRVGNVKGKISEADIQARGDDLKMFKNNSLDYVVSRHNLEHYQNPRKTLKEWLRVLKKRGLIGIIVPNSTNPETSEKTHYFNFTLKNLRELIHKTSKLKIIKIGECIPNWSFYCIAKKIS